MESEPNEGRKLKVEARTVYYKEVEDRQTKIEHYIKVELEDPEQMAHDQRQKIKIDPHFYTYHDKFIGVLTESESMWDGHLGSRSLAKHGMN